MSKPRQAVVIIHGIGEQRPMQTLRSFTLGVLNLSETDVHGKPAFYNKPDPNAEGFEVRRYRVFKGRVDSDYIEFYWQHHMPIAAWRFLLSWLWLMMQRPAAAMPRRFVFLWWISWITVMSFIFAALVGFAAWMFGVPSPLPTVPTLTGAAAIIIGAVGFTVRSFVGDAAIYLNPHPRTVEARNKIREAGVTLIERLLKDGRYDRIIIVGHSLGSVIGYDILNFAWHRASEAFRKKVEAGDLNVDAVDQSELKLSEEAAAADPPPETALWQRHIRSALAEQRQLGLNWLVSDFITLGSPLAHAELLLAKSPKDLKRRVAERELATAPPYLEDGAHFSFKRTGTRPDGTMQSARVPDHAALFGLTAWTNLYFPCRYMLRGDLVGGPVRPWFGSGVRDVAVSTRVRGGWLSHTLYWTRFENSSADPLSAPQALVEALDLSRSTFPRRRRSEEALGASIAHSGLSDATTTPLSVSGGKARNGER